MRPLVMMACSATKASARAPAFDLYQGVMYKTFRACVKPLARPEVVILSAMHGFVQADAILAPYEQRMTKARAEEMLANLPHFMKAVCWPDSITQVFLAGGKDYRDVMRPAIAMLYPRAQLIECFGGIGYQRSQLGNFLKTL
ncbi:hypothetical protein RCH14_004549 [Massilia sp. MP_M2]|uniref:DUF6884 domain-containing protein n=1 Tax=Massilia sp. MP_M2 TaxID=3071713 RepID=UPI00319E3FE0